MVWQQFGSVRVEPTDHLSCVDILLFNQKGVMPKFFDDHAWTKPPRSEFLDSVWMTFGDSISDCVSDLEVMWFDMRVILEFRLLLFVSGTVSGQLAGFFNSDARAVFGSSEVKKLR